MPARGAQCHARRRSHCPAVMAGGRGVRGDDRGGSRNGGPLRSIARGFAKADVDMASCPAECPREAPPRTHVRDSSDAARRARPVRGPVGECRIRALDDRQKKTGDNASHVVLLNRGATPDEMKEVWLAIEACGSNEYRTGQVDPLCGRSGLPRHLATPSPSPERSWCSACGNCSRRSPLGRATAQPRPFDPLPQGS